MTRPLCFILLLLSAPYLAVGASAPAAAAAGPAKPAPDKESKWIFSLLPKSLQQNPRLELTVITEVSEAGKKLPPVTPQAPAYFEAVSGGYKPKGQLIANEKTVPEAEITKLLLQSLATAGYLPSKLPDHPASIAIVYTWGPHNLLVEGDEENPSISGAALAANLLDRAALVGGQKFSDRLKKAFYDADNLATAARKPPTDPTGTVPDLPPTIGEAQMEFMNPVEIFRRENEKNDFLVDQSVHDVYYIVATAYDYAALKNNKPVQLWRTRMTVASQGVTQEQTLPAMVMAAGPYFGKEMEDPAIISKRVVREGRVEVGTPEVVEPKK